MVRFGCGSYVMTTRGGAGMVGGLMAASILDKSSLLSVARVMVLVG